MTTLLDSLFQEKDLESGKKNISELFHLQDCFVHQSMLAQSLLILMITQKKNAFQKDHFMGEVQMMTEHARRKSVKKYASVQLDAKRRLMGEK